MNINKMSPALWSEEELKHFTAQNLKYETLHKMTTGKKGIVSCTTHGFAARAGVEALNQGGTAADAVIATSLAQIALAAGCYVSYGGIHTLIYYNAKEDKVYCNLGEYGIPLAENDPMSIPFLGSGIPSGRTALVPGYFAGVEAAHKKFGRLPWADLFEPAKYLCREGFEINSYIDTALTNKKKFLSRLPEARAVFTKPDGEFYKLGDHFTQPELLKTLDKVSEQGADYIYHGDWAKKFVASVQAEGGVITMEDMERYESDWCEPVSLKYGEHDTIYAPGLPNYGGVMTLVTLALLKHGKISERGHFTKNAESLFWTIQAGKVGNLVMAICYGAYTPDQLKEMFKGKDICLENILDSESIAHIWDLMQKGELAVTEPINREGTPRIPTHSDAIVSIDDEGNMAAVIHTINAVQWGETGIFVDGISIPDSAVFQQGVMLMAGAGNKLPAPTNPMLILRDGKPFLASSSIGAGLLQKTYSSIYNVLEFGMNVEEAQNTANHLAPETPKEDGSYRELLVDSEWDPELLEEARALGLNFTDPSNAMVFLEHAAAARAMDGMWVAATVDENKTYTGITCKYFNGAAVTCENDD